MAGGAAASLLTRKEMLTPSQIHDLANHWVNSWNSHDLDEIMSHYASDVVFVSPVAAKTLNDPGPSATASDDLDP